MSFEISKINPFVQLTWRELEEKKDNFNDKFKQALRDGFFYVEIPEKLKTNTPHAQAFGNSIRANDSLHSLDLGERLGYQVRQGTQAIAFSAMHSQWEKVFPEPVKDLAIEMNTMALKILKISLEQLQVPQDQWSLVTGELIDGKGSNVFSFNSYKPDRQKIGLIGHKDMGWITVLFCDKLGLETSLDGKNWVSVAPKEGYAVINFGQAYEKLLNDKSKLRASVHRVRRLEEERLSFGVFINHKEGSDIYQMNADNQVEKIGTYEDYLNSCFSEFQKLQQELTEAP